MIFALSDSLKDVCKRKESVNWFWIVWHVGLIHAIAHFDHFDRATDLQHISVIFQHPAGRIAYLRVNVGSLRTRPICNNLSMSVFMKTIPSFFVMFLESICTA